MENSSQRLRRLDPDDDTVIVGFRTTEAQKEKLRQVAQACGITLSTLLRRMSDDIARQRSQEETA